MAYLDYNGLEYLKGKLDDTYETIADANDLKSKIDDIIDYVSVSVDADWTDSASASYPVGWSSGYFNKDTGGSAASNYYIRTVSSHRYSVNEATMLEVTAPSGYCIAAYEYQPDGSTFVRRIGNANASQDDATSHLLFTFEKRHCFSFALGRFENAADTTAHLTTEFVSQIKATFYTLKNSTFTNPPSLSYTYVSSLQAAISFPSSYKPDGKPTPLLIIAHGQTSQLNSNGWIKEDMTTLASQFVTQGFAVLDVQRVTEADWINPALIKKYVAAIEYATKIYNIIPTVVFAESMGNLIGLCLAKQFSTIKTCVVTGLRLDMEARYADLSAENKAIVDANLGFTDGYNPYIAAGWDRLAFSTTDGNNNNICLVQFPPTLFIYATQDDYVAESLAKVEQIKRGGTICESKEYVGNHNDVCYLKPEGCFDYAIAWMRLWI